MFSLLSLSFALALAPAGPRPVITLDAPPVTSRALAVRRWDATGHRAMAARRWDATGHRAMAARRWDASGHRAMAAIAYDRLSEGTRRRVDSLLRVHPDLDSLAVNVDANTAAGVRELFLRLSVWPDRIRRDRRFYDELNPSASPTPLLPGFPSMASRSTWHYLPRGFSTDGTPTQVLTAPNAVTAMPGFADALADHGIPASVRAYGLGWLVHVIGDLHQPLHGISRASAAHPNGDSGGNAEWVQIGEASIDTSNLHAVWDGMVRRTARDVPLDELAQQLVAELPIDSASADLHIPSGAAFADAVQRWADESAVLSRYVVYAFPTRTAGGPPPRLPDAYLALAGGIARERITLAAYRLAALLEARLAP
jgi:hypothetical protein